LLKYVVPSTLAFLLIIASGLIPFQQLGANAADSNAATTPTPTIRIASPTAVLATPTTAARIDTSPGWVKVTQSTDVWAEPLGLPPFKQASLPTGTLVEILRDAPGSRVYVRYPGDGRRTAPGAGWTVASSLERIAPDTEFALPRAYPATTGSGVVRLSVPYQSQLDGSPWAEANCGPTSLSMAMDWFGKTIPSGELRAEALDAQKMWGNEAGTLLDALATVAQANGVRVIGLWDGDNLKRWSVAEIRDELKAGRPVIVQVRFRALPQREDSLYWGDHYIVLTGFIGDNILYNDAVDSDGVGYDRIMSNETLANAMRTSDARYTAAAFALAH
jgi:uncharacterized protein YvpB